MKNPDKFKEAAENPVARGAFRFWTGVLTFFALAMFVAGFFVGKEYASLTRKIFKTADAREQAADPGIEEAFVKNYEAALDSEGQADLIESDPKLRAMWNRSRRASKRIEAMPPKRTGPVVNRRAETGAPPASFDKPRFTLQVRALKDETAARREVERLKGLGIDAVHISKSPPWFRVRIGRFATEKQMTTFRTWYETRHGHQLYPDDYTP